MVRPPSRGRQRIDMVRIVDKERSQVTFSKRRAGLFKKASEIYQLCGARVAVVAFSNANNSFGVGTPSVDHVLRRHAPLPGEEGDALLAALDDAAEREAVEALVRRTEEAGALVAAEEARMAAIGRNVLEAAVGRQFWWEADVEALGEAELPEFTRALQRLRGNVQHVADKRLKGK